MISTGDLTQLAVLLSMLDVPTGGGGGGSVTQAEVQRAAFNYSPTTNTGDAYVVTLDPVPPAYVGGLLVSIIANHTNTTTSPTMQVDGLAAIPIVGSLGESVVPEDITEGEAYLLLYNADNNNFQLLNPSITDANAYLVQNNYFNYNPDIGTTNAYAVNLNLVPLGGSGYPDGITVWMLASTDNTGTATLSVNGRTALDITLSNGNRLLGGEITGGGLYLLQYNSQFDKWNLLTPNESSSFVTLGVTNLNNSFSLGSLTSGLIKNTVVDDESTLSTAVNGVDYWAPGDVITLPGDPTTSFDAANKGYVDAVAAGLNPTEAVIGASTANLTGYTYSPGASGVGATLTAGSNGAFIQDGITYTIGQRFLYKNDTTGSGAYNGIYDVTTVGDGSTQAVLTRAVNYDTPSNINLSGLVPVLFGTVNAGSGWLNTSTVVTVGVTPINYVQFGQVSGIVSPVNGGTGVSNASGSTITLNGAISFAAAYAFNQSLNTAASPTFAGLTASNVNIAGSTISTVTANSSLFINPNGTGRTVFDTATEFATSVSVQIAAVSSNADLVLGTFSAVQSNASVYYLYKSHSAVVGTFSAVSNGDILGLITSRGDDGTTFTNSASIAFNVQGSVSTGIVPGQITFSTCTTAGVLTQALSISNAQVAQFANAIITAGVNDVNNLPVVTFNSDVTPVNYLTLTSAATGGAFKFGTAGGDADISFNFIPKGAGFFQITSSSATIPLVISNGTAAQHITNFAFANTAATRTVTFQDSSGTVAFVGDIPSNNYVESTVSQDAPITIPPSTGVATTVTSLTLAAGNWVVGGNGVCRATGLVNALVVGISGINNGFEGDSNGPDPDWPAATINGLYISGSNVVNELSTGAGYFTFSVPTTVYLVVQYNCNNATAFAWGKLWAYNY